ncbi:MAG: 50S ribosomal protein L17 [Candidatus Spechtbacterales bacterium]
MKKGSKGRKFNRKRDQRKALMSHLAESLIREGRIETTQAKAKSLRPFIEKWITKSSEPTLHARRILGTRFTPTATKKLLEDLGPRFKERHGGYTRIIKREPRKGDSAPRAIIEFIE